MLKLNGIVEKMLLQHKGGQKFFDNLDAAVQDEEIVNALFEMIWEDRGFALDFHFIGSGKFGNFIHNLASAGILIPEYWKIVTVSGDLRHNPCGMDDLSYMDLKEKKFLFIDDSYYQGRTRDCIEAELRRNGAELVHTYVIYDGSVKRDLNVSSLYRYHK